MRITFENKTEIRRFAQILQEVPDDILITMDDLEAALREYPELPWEDGFHIPLRFAEGENRHCTEVVSEEKSDATKPSAEAQYAYLAGQLDACFRLQESEPIRLQEIEQISGLRVEQLLFLRRMWVQQVI